MKTWITGIIVCGLFLSGCGAVDDKKLSEDTSAAQQTSAVPTETPRIDSAQNVEEKLPFQIYIEKYPERLTDKEEWKTADGGYHFPVARNDLKEIDDWEEKNAACQIPKDIMESLDTDVLLKTVLEYPFLDEIIFSDSCFRAVNHYAKEFNGLYEPLHRVDCYENVLSYYENMDIPRHKKNHLDKLLPENPTDKDYDEVTDKGELRKIEEDMRVEASIDFCITVLAGMTQNVEKNILKYAGEVLSERFLEIEKSEYSDVIKKEDLQDASWADQTVVKAMVKSVK